MTKITRENEIIIGEMLTKKILKEKGEQLKGELTEQLRRDMEQYFKDTVRSVSLLFKDNSALFGNFYLRIHCSDISDVINDYVFEYFKVYKKEVENNIEYDQLACDIQNNILDFLIKDAEVKNGIFLDYCIGKLEELIDTFNTIQDKYIIGLRKCWKGKTYLATIFLNLEGRTEDIIVVDCDSFKSIDNAIWKVGEAIKDFSEN